ncbi:coat protein [Phaius virus X]|uniref:Coat protein n=1 Tax=Phaius virus X TaxID=457382 RepID=B0I2Z6_9VIRU|nr:coat protein [Phaius virus X]BAG06158.1 coat protein [Phaius virus X]
MATTNTVSKFGPANMQAWMDLKYEPTSESLVSEGELLKIQEQWAAIGVTGDFFTVAFQVAMVCSDAHSGSQTVLPGMCNQHPNIPLSAIGGIIRNVTTLRRFCRYYAKFVWNYRVANALPPANWAELEFTEETKYAAFDFFDGVTNVAALDPPNGLVRNPSEREFQASRINRYAAIARVASSGFTTTAAEVTKGRATAYQVHLLDAP